MQVLETKHDSKLFAVFLSWILIFNSCVASDVYHRTKDLVEALRHTATACPHANPQWLSLRHTSHSYFQPRPPEGRLLMISISRSAEFRASPTRTDRPGSIHTKLVAVFGEHPRERVTTELALEILMRYCSRAPTNASFILLPIANLPNRFRVDTGNSCERLNHRSVDLNRNYVYQWGRRDRETVIEEEPPGVRPLSEFETASIDGLVQQISPTAYVSIHSGDMGILVPWDSGEQVEGRVRNIANVVQQRHCPACRVGSAQTLFGYRAYGTGVDHMFGVRHVPFACTLEIYGAATDDCELMFNPNNRSMLSQVLRNWSGVLETIAGEVHSVSLIESSRLNLPKPKGYVVSIVEDPEVTPKKMVLENLPLAMLFVVLIFVAVFMTQRRLGFGQHPFWWDGRARLPFTMTSRQCESVSGSKIGVRRAKRGRKDPYTIV